MIDDPVVDPVEDPVVDPVADPDPVVDPDPEPAVTEVETISRDVLPEELRGMPADEVKMYISAMRRGLVARTTELETLRAEAEGKPPAAAATVETYEIPEQMSKEDLQALILDDPEKALDYYADRKFGARFMALEDKAGETAIINGRAVHEGFDDVEKEVRIILDKVTSPTAEGVKLAYEVAMGRKAIATAATTRARTLSSEPPSKRVKETITKQFTGERARFSRALGIESEEELAEWSGDGYIEVTPPGVK